MALPKMGDLTVSVRVPFKNSVIKEAVITMLRFQLSQKIIFVRILQKR